MAKSFKICPVREFRAEAFADQGFPLKPQFVLPQIAGPPQTIIRKARDTISVRDFLSFIIEHEHEITMRGRINQVVFEKCIRTGIMSAYFSASEVLLLVTGKKDDILDFCRRTPDLPDIRIATIQIDMKALLARLAEVRLAWFRFPAGLIRASALMGAHLEKTDEFAEAQAAGDISTLSFYFQMGATAHPVMVTADGAIVLQDAYREIADEIEIVMRIKQDLLDGLYSEEEPRAACKKVQQPPRRLVGELAGR
jgi:hypothetical protein